MIDLSDIAYVVAFWFVDAGARHGQDFLACVYRDTSGQWQASYRFRYSHSGAAFDERDTRNWYEIRPKTDDADPARTLTEAMDAAAEKLVHGGFCDPGDYCRVEVNGDAKLAWERISAQSWCNMKFEAVGSDLPLTTSQRGQA